MNAAAFHAVAPCQIFNRSVIAGCKDFINLMGNWVLLAMITCGKIALKPKSVDTDAKSVIRDLWVLKDARTAPRTDRKTVPRHPSTCTAKEHSSMLTKIWSGGMQLATGKRIGLACKLQNKNCFKSRPQKRGAKNEP